MSRINKVLNNSIILFVQHILVGIIAIAAIGFIARKLGKSDYGIYALAFAFPGLFSEIGSMGLRNLTIQEVAKNRENAVKNFIGRIIPLRLILICAMGLVTIISAKIFNYESNEFAAIVIGTISAMIDSISRIIQDIFQSFEEMGKIAIRDMSIRLFTALIGCYMVYINFGVLALCWLYVIGNLIGLSFNLILFKKRFEVPVIIWDYDFCRFNLKESAGYFLAGIGGTIIGKTDIIIISKLLDNGSIGIFNAAATLSGRLGIFADAIATSASPAISHLFWSNRNESENVLNKSCWLALIITIPIAFGGIVLSEEIINLIYGKAFKEATIIFRVLVCCLPIGSCYIILISSLNAIRKQFQISKILLVISLINIVTSVILIKNYELIGAVINCLITSLFCLFSFTILGKKYFQLHIDFSKIAVITASSLFMVLFLMLTEFYNLFIRIGIGGICYCSVVIIFDRNIRQLALEKVIYFNTRKPK